MKGETTSRRIAGCNLRSGIFWGADTLRGSPIGRHWKDLEEMYEVGIEEATQGRVDYRLENILDIACRTTKFYERHKLEEGLSSFPVVDKNVIRTNLGAFLSSAYPDRERIPAITSGSTGTPFVTYQNREKKQRNIADTLFFARLAGYELGEKLFYLKIWSELNHKSRVIQHLQNVVPVDVLDLQAEVPKVIDTMNRCRSSINILGYVSAVETICRTLDRHKMLRPTVNVNSIITMSEGLDDYTRQAGERHFGCPVLARYSNIENGIIAQQTVSERSSLIVNTASYLIEILDFRIERRDARRFIGPDCCDRLFQQCDAIDSL